MALSTALVSVGASAPGRAEAALKDTGGGSDDDGSYCWDCTELVGGSAACMTTNYGVDDCLDGRRCDRSGCKDICLKGGQTCTTGFSGGGMFYP